MIAFLTQAQHLMMGDTHTQILSQHQRRKKGKYIETFLERRRHFMTLVFSVDGVMGDETHAAPKKLYASL